MVYSFTRIALSSVISILTTRGLRNDATILTSQLPTKKWHAQIGDPTLADSILDRLVHRAYRIEMDGESMRKEKLKALAPATTGGRS